MMHTNHAKFAVVAALVLAFAIAFVPSASATTTTAQFQVTATVANTCTISGATLAFGAYSGALVTGTSNLTVKCSNFALYSIALDKGQGSGGSFATRYMTNGTSTLGYQLCTASGCGTGTIWGDGSTGSSTVAGTGTGANQTIAVYGQIPASENSISGNYSDTITATITY